MANEGALATLDDEAALDRIASGTLSKVIAGEYGVTPYAVRKRLAQHPDYPQAIRDQAESLVELATDEAIALEKGCDMVAIARARIKVETAHKWAAARDPRRWGGKLDITSGDKPLQLGDSHAVMLETARAMAFIMSASDRIIEGELSTDCTAIAAPQHADNNSNGE